MKKVKMRRIAFMTIIVLTIVGLMPCAPYKAEAASSVTITNPLQRGAVNAYAPLTVTWEAPSGSVSKYVINVRVLEQTEADSVLIVDNVSLSSSTLKYKIPWSKLKYGGSYRISIQAVLTNGTIIWSPVTYFFVSTYKVVANKTISFYIYNGFNTDWKNAIYYSAQTWNKVLNLGYEMVNTYPYYMGHNSQTINSGDGINRITNAAPDENDRKVLGATYIKRSAGKVVEADININDTYQPFTVGAKSGYYDLQSIMTHEMGHAVGLAHCYESFASSWTMYYAGTKNSIEGRSLTSADAFQFGCIYLNI